MSRGTAGGSANKAATTTGGGGGGGGDGDSRGVTSPWGGYSMFGPMFPALHTLDHLYAEMMDNVERVHAELNRLYYPPFGMRPFHAIGPAGAAATPPALRAPPGEFPLAVAGGGGGSRGGVGGLMPYYRGASTDIMSPFYAPPLMMPFSRGLGAVAPRVDFMDVGDEYLMKADVPGVDKNNVKIHVQNGVMHITGEQQQESKEERKGFFMQERHQTAFSRSVPLPENVREDDIRATMKDGVLEVHIPKVHTEKANIKKIHVE